MNNRFLEDIEFASKINDEIKKAEQRGIDNSLNITKEFIKQQYGDIEQLKQENKQLKERIKYLERSNNRREELIDEQRAEIFDLEENRDKAIEEIKKELKKNNHLSYGVALSIIAILNNYEEILKGVSNE